MQCSFSLWPLYRVTVFIGLSRHQPKVSDLHFAIRAKQYVIRLKGYKYKWLNMGKCLFVYMLKHNSLLETKNKYLQVSVDEIVWMDVFYSTDNFIKYFMDFQRGSLFVHTISRSYPRSQCSSLTELHLNKQIRPAAETDRERTGMTHGWIFHITLYCLKGVVSFFIFSYNTFRIIILFLLLYKFLYC